MKILAIDTSSKTCSVAITEDAQKIIELHSNDEKTHSVKLMPMIDEALKQSNLTLDDIGLLACSVGPGSFTGVRIGISTVKAFADVKHIPVVSVTSLEGLAYNAILQNMPVGELAATLFCPIIDAKNKNVYCGLYRYYNDAFNQMTDLIAEDINTVIAKIDTTVHSFDSLFRHIVFVGDGATIYKELLQKAFTDNNISITFLENEKNEANSISIALSGYSKYVNGNYGDSSILTPVYLRKSQAERELEAKQSH